jgi:hypothetical protein
MKLSEAIREGAKLRPQTFGSFFDTNSENVVCSCTLGAAFEGKTGYVSLKLEYVNQLHPVFPELATQVELNGLRRDLAQAVTQLNDGERWTREQIADWLEEKGY